VDQVEDKDSGNRTNDEQGKSHEVVDPLPLSHSGLGVHGPERTVAHRIRRTRGSIVLGTDGCGMYWHLIVTGPHCGHIWLITSEGATPFGAEFGHTTRESGFADWVKHWAAGNEPGPPTWS